MAATETGTQDGASATRPVVLVVVLGLVPERLLTGPALRGRRAALGALELRYRSRLVAFCAQALGSQVAGEDAAEVVLAEARDALRRGPRCTHPYRTLLLRAAHDHVVGRPRPRGAEPAAMPGLDRLTDTQRVALLLRHAAGLECREVGECMGISASCAREILVAARVALAEEALIGASSGQADRHDR
jgi:DNA-directed RNA polymerase specialized sigma24 family protein